MDTYEAIRSRRSVRLFDSAPVDRRVLERVLEAACDAPSSQNSQPWHFHVATGATREAVVQEMALTTVYLRDYLDSLPPDHTAEAERFFATLGGAPIVIGVSVPVAPDELTRINDYIAVGCALQNLQLAAYAEGLGACNLTFSFWVRDQLSETLHVPAGREIVSLVILGHPSEEPDPKPRATDRVTFLN